MTQSPERTGAIYDIGYRGYTGPRLGRRSALESMFWQSFRASFGLGRRPLAKIAPWLLTGLAVIPAIVYLGIAAILPVRDVIDIIPKTSEYLVLISIILILFVASVAPEVVGRDLRFRTLSLYFTRPVERDDYALARVGGLAAAATAITLVPQLTLVIGNALAGDEPWEYLREQWEEVPQVLVSGVITAVYMSAVGIAIACHTHRRSYAMGGIVGFFIISGVIGGVLSEILAGEFLLIDPFTQLQAMTYFVFNEDAPQDSGLDVAGVPLVAGVLVLFGYLAAALTVITRRYRRMSA